MSDHPSDSEAQRRVERLLVDGVAREIGIPLAGETVPLEGSTVQIDGMSREHRVLCEAFAHVGTLKAGQKRKLGNDVLKLLYAERCLTGTWRKVLAVPKGSAAVSAGPGGWQAHALSMFNIDIVPVELGAEIMIELKEAQLRQAR